MVRLCQFIFIALLFIQAVSCKKKDNSDTINPSIITDIDGNIYHSVTIGTQVWMVENLSTTRLNDGTAIPLVYDPWTWQQMTTPGYCWYNHETVPHQDVYGALYNFYAVNSGKLAPKGWHIPSYYEWTTLIYYLGGDSIAGAKLKEKGTTHWFYPNLGATNESGFTALPGGLVTNNIFYNRGYHGCWWTSSIDDYFTGFAWFWGMSFENTEMYQNSVNLFFGLSVRCIRN